MSRDIKFRAWHKGCSDKYGRPHPKCPPQMLYDEKPGDCLSWLNEGQNIEQVMQFTGLLDRNGKEIYEGDVVSAGDGGVFEVRFEFAGWHFAKTPQSAYYAYPSFHSNASRMTIIGNIHENPELLEVRS